MGIKNHSTQLNKNLISDIEEIDMSVDTKDTKALVVSKEVVELSEKISKSLKVNDQGIVENDQQLYLDNAPKIVKDSVAAVDAYDAVFAASLLRSFGPKAIEHLKATPENKRVSGEIYGGAKDRKFMLNYTAPSGKKADGTPKDPSVTVVRRLGEHPDHAAVRHEIYAKTSELFS